MSKNEKELEKKIQRLWAETNSFAREIHIKEIALTGLVKRMIAAQNKIGGDNFANQFMAELEQSIENAPDDPAKGEMRRKLREIKEYLENN